MAMSSVHAGVGEVSPGILSLTVGFPERRHWLLHGKKRGKLRGGLRDGEHH